MKAVVAAFNQEKALVGAFSVIVQLHRLIDLRHYQAALCGAGGEVMCKTAEQMRGLTADNDLSYSTAQSALRLYMWGGIARGAAPRDTARVLSQHS